MATRTELTEPLIALIPEDGSRISNAAIKAALEKKAGNSYSEAELKEMKSQVIFMETAEADINPSGGLKAAGIYPPPRTGAAPKKAKSAAPSLGAIAHRTEKDSILKGALDDKSTWIWAVIQEETLDKHVRKRLQQTNQLWMVVDECRPADEYLGEK